MRRGNRLIYIQSPSFEEMPEIAKLWKDDATMKEVGGAIHFEQERWQAGYKRMVFLSDGCNKDCLIYNHSHEVVGEVSFHRFNHLWQMV